MFLFALEENCKHHDCWLDLHMASLQPLPASKGHVLSITYNSRWPCISCYEQMTPTCRISDNSCVVSAHGFCGQEFRSALLNVPLQGLSCCRRKTHEWVSGHEQLRAHQVSPSVSPGLPLWSPVSWFRLPHSIVVWAAGWFLRVARSFKNEVSATR